LIFDVFFIYYPDFESDWHQLKDQKKRDHIPRTSLWHLLGCSEWPNDLAELNDESLTWDASSSYLYSLICVGLVVSGNGDMSLRFESDEGMHGLSG
jgi:hypothetical protein